MMLVLACILPLISALACLLLSRAVPTRWLGIGAAAALVICGVALVAAKLRSGLPIVLLDRAWLTTVDNRTLRATLQFDALSWALAALAWLGGGLALLVLALLVPGNLRGFGGLFAAAELAIMAAVAGLANQSAVLLPFAWSLVALLTFLALQASGALAGSDGPGIVLLAGLCGALVALGAALLSPSTAGLILWVVLCMLALGAPPFQAPAQRLAEAPAALAGMLLALGLPLIGGVALLRFLSDQAAGLSQGWRVGLTMLGALTLLVCAAGAIGATRLRGLLSWQLSAQMGLVIVAAAQGGPALSVVAPALLLNAALSTLVGFLAVALLERRAGTDDLHALALRKPLFWPGLLLLVGAASAVGLPGFWGFWPRRWLVEALLRTTPWAVAIVLAGSTLLAVAFLPALAAFWRGATSEEERAAPRREPLFRAVLIGLIGALPLIILGIAPQIAWNSWLAELSGAAPTLPSRATQAVCAAAAALLIAAPAVLRSRTTEAGAEVAEHSASIVAPDAIAESLGGLAWAGTATAVFAGLWAGLLRACRLLLSGLVLFEQRYYLAGLLIAVIVVIMLFIQ